MNNPESTAAPPKVGRITFQPLLPQPAHATRNLLLWGLPAVMLEGLAAAVLIWAFGTGVPLETEPPTVIHFVELPSEVSIPKPPPPPPPPELPRAEPSASGQLVKGFQTLTMPTITLTEIPPPTLGEVHLDPIDFSGEGFEGGRGGAAVDATPAPIDAAPAFTPFTVAPWLKNSDEIARALEREYPPSLRNAGIGERVLMWLFIDETGRVQRTQVKESSGFNELDAAAARVATRMEFAPAVNRDRRVAVWVALPIDFEVSHR